MGVTGRGRTWALVAAMAVAGLAGQLLAWRVPGEHVPAGGLAWFAFVAAGFVLAEMLVVHVCIGRSTHTLSFTEIPLVVGLVFLPPELLVLARLTGSVPTFAFRRRTPVKVAFNLTWGVLETAVAVLVWYAVAAGARAHEPRAWLAVALVVVTTSLLGIALVSAAIVLHGGGGPRVREAISLGAVMDLVNASLAVVVLIVLDAGPHTVWLAAVLVAALGAGYRSYDRLRRRAQALDRLNRFTEQVSSEHDVDSVVAAVLARVGEALEADSVALLVAEGSPLGRRHWVQRDGRLTRPRTVEDDVLVGLAPALERPVRVPRVRRRRQADVRLLEQAHVQDLVAAPLTTGGTRLGILVAADHAGDLQTFSPDDLRELQALANHAGVALEGARRADLLRREVAERGHQALHDELTGLPNRRGFHEFLAPVPQAAVLMLDLDHFKEINDSLGHHAGDRLLSMTAQRIRETLHGSEVVARLGGDEFAILLPGADEPRALARARELREALTRPFPLEGVSIAVDASVGVAVGTRTVGPGTLLRRADIAMYAAKAAGGGVLPYREGLERPSPQRLTMLADLRDAVAARALDVVFQPKVAVPGGTVCGVEALVRWHHRRLGHVRPEDFVAVAEHGGLIHDITRIVLARALDETARWRVAGRDLGVSVNVSPRCLLAPGFTADVAAALVSRGLPPGQLTLEITETSLMTEPDAAIGRLHELRDLGVRLSIDDLGTGYSSLAYLQRLPVDEVKIDRSFLQEAGDASTATVIEAIVDLGHRLGRVVVAEGVENEPTWQRLRRLDCDVAQGYWVSPPLPAHEVLSWVERWEESHPVDLRTPSDLSAYTA